jgi:hypothetical protein
LQSFLLDELEQQGDVIHVTQPSCDTCYDGDLRPGVLPVCAKPAGNCYCGKCTIDEDGKVWEDVKFRHIATVLEQLSELRGKHSDNVNVRLSNCSVNVSVTRRLLGANCEWVCSVPEKGARSG